MRAIRYRTGTVGKVARPDYQVESSGTTVYVLGSKRVTGLTTTAQAK